MSNFIELTLKDNNEKRIIINIDAIEMVTNYDNHAYIQCRNSRQNSFYIVEESYDELLEILLH